MRKKAAFRRLILQWGRDNLRDFPWRTNRTPYSVLISEILLRRTTASAVARIYSTFMETFSNPSRLLESTKTELTTMLSSIGYHKIRASILRDVSGVLVEKFGGAVPCSRESLLEIPHVGSYTAGAVLSFGCGVSSAIIDTNVERIYSRLFLSSLPEKGARHLIEEIADLYVPKDNHQIYNFSLLDLGALVCTYGVPKCSVCPLSSLCDYYSKGMPSRHSRFLNLNQ